MSSAGHSPADVLTTPANLDTLAAVIRSLSHRVEGVAVAARGAFAELAAAVPGSLLAQAIPAGQSTCSQMLAAEARQLAQLAERLRLSAETYRENERRLAARAYGLSR
jgi:hypothetical protein